ncbi:hypothetical protein K1719_033484 [Acacia pycnantha]|nr:hypothetical protein K1719_033484 [Acacia pycnantha]
MDKTKLNTFKGFRTFVVVGFIAFPILVIVTLINHNSIPLLIEESSQTDVLGERAGNVSTNVLKEGEDVSLTVTPQAMGEKGQNVTGSEVDQKNQVIVNLSNDSYLSDTVANDKLLNELLAPTFDEGSCLSRMITLAASFLYAILTDRVLLVRFGSDMVGLFCEPFPNSSW